MSITGYRELDADEVALINQIKAAGIPLKELLTQVSNSISVANEVHGIADAEPRRWVAIARTHFQEGLMALTRAVARPEHF